MSVTIYLIRHGEAAASWGDSPDPGLSPQGILEAERAASELSVRVPIPMTIVSSPMQRAVETAQPLSVALNQPASIEPVFSEVPSPVPIAQRHEWLKTMMSQTWGEQPTPIQAWRSAILSRLKSMTEHTAIFSHFMVINAVVSNLLARDKTVCFLPDNGSITTITVSNGQITLDTLGAENLSLVN
ncbi:MAG: histidine phosphatase family protein [Woeseiaceae bacterium]